MGWGVSPFFEYAVDGNSPNPSDPSSLVFLRADLVGRDRKREAAPPLASIHWRLIIMAPPRRELCDSNMNLRWLPAAWYTTARRESRVCVCVLLPARWCYRKPVGEVLYTNCWPNMWQLEKVLAASVCYEPCRQKDLPTLKSLL